MKSNIYPVKIKAKSEGIENAETLLQEKRLQIGLSEPDTVQIKGGGYLILDFGREQSGGIRILTHGANGDKRVRLRFGESLSETCAELGEKNATNDHSNRDFTVELQNYSDMTFGNTGFRFVRLDFLGKDSGFGIKSIVAASDEDEREEVGRFECDDPVINEIWNTASRTLRLCLHNGYFWDGVKRDRLVWIGDLYPEMRSSFCLYKNTSETENSLIFAKEQTPLPGWINGIPMYSMWWLIILSENYFHGGDRKFAQEQLSYVQGLLEQLDEYVLSDGSTAFAFNFIDWPTHYEAGGDKRKEYDELAGVNYLLRIALNATSKLLRALGKDDGICEKMTEKLKRKSYEVKAYKQIAALGVWAGEKTEYNRRLITEGGASGISTFMSYPILSAVTAYGEYDKAFAILKEYYGGMLKMGATTFWEDFDLSWTKNASRIDGFPKPGEKDIHGDYGAFCYTGFRHSLCHGWASGVIAYLTETVLGITPTGIGGQRIKIEPHLSGLKHVKGSYPCGNGELEVEHKINSKGEIESRIIAPVGIELVK